MLNLSLGLLRLAQSRINTLSSEVQYRPGMKCILGIVLGIYVYIGNSYTDLYLCGDKLPSILFPFEPVNSLPTSG